MNFPIIIFKHWRLLSKYEVWNSCSEHYLLAHVFHQELHDKLLKLQPEISIAEDHARQIAASCSPEERSSVLSEVETAQQQLSDLQAVLHTRMQQCLQIQLDREDFETAVSETVAWLEEKEDVLASLRPLHLDSDKVDPVMEKHKVCPALDQ